MREEYGKSLHAHGKRGHGTEDWRYIHYADGGEELYDLRADRYEWTNLADEPSSPRRWGRCAR